MRAVGSAVEVVFWNVCDVNLEIDFLFVWVIG
jgi:hypothetical protein